MENYLRNTELYKKWQSYGIEDKYCLFVGSAALLMKGIRKLIHDLDIVILDTDVWEKFSKGRTLEKSATTDAQVVILEDGKMEVAHSFLEQHFGKEIDWNDCIEVIDDLNILKLEFVKRYKQILNRPKDQRDLKLIEEYERNK